MDAAQRQQQQQQQLRQPRTTQGGPTLGAKDLIIRMLAEVFQVSQTQDGQVRWQQVSSSLVPVSLYSRTTSKWLNYLLAASSGSSCPAELAAASSTASAMSPDSRDFLLLLQQFHYQQQQQQMLLTTSTSVDEQQRQLQKQEVLIFQVVAHDYIDAQCKKILSVKLAQPGTRLGQASDYFVYWKEHPQLHRTSNQQQQHSHQSHQLHQQQHQHLPMQSSSSFASNGSQALGFGQQSRRSQQGQQQQFLSPLTPRAGTSRSSNNLQPVGGGEPRTWGLNFASVNDAKLFYDICSLNLVDLDFNSDYLKLLAASDRNSNGGQLIAHRPQHPPPPPTRQQLSSLVAKPVAPLVGGNWPLQQQGEQKVIRDFLNYKQRLQQQQQYLCQTSSAAAPASKAEQNLIKSQWSASKCPACKHLLELGLRSRQQQQFLQQQSQACPVHSRQHQQLYHQQQQHLHGQRQALQASQDSSSLRARSRSTTRASAAASGGGSNDNVDQFAQRRARSFSTPASPERDLADHEGGGGCPVHRRHQQPQHQHQHQHHHLQQQQHRQHQLQQQHGSSTDCEQGRLSASSQHHPRCISFIRQQRELLKKQSTVDSERPLKPARGVLRDPTVAASCVVESRLQQQQAPPVPAHQSQQGSSAFVAPTSGQQQQRLPQVSKRQQSRTSQVSSAGAAQVPRPQQHNRQQQQQQTQRADFELLGRGGNNSRKSCPNEEQQQLEGQLASRFAGSRYPARRSTVIEATAAPLGPVGSSDAADAADVAHRDARQARAQYAQSKLMKEFLSLDAGGNQLTPTRLADLNHRFEQQMKNNATTSEASTSANNNNIAYIVGQAAKSRSAAGGASTASAGSNSAQLAARNASTTTDDLPLDPSTRRRMFKLTSEEMISERTEPKSASTSNTAKQEHSQSSATPTKPQQQQQQRNFNQNDNGKARAVSLGPEVGVAELRGRSARSDAGRRRSLERSTCVDLDSTLAAGSSPAGGGGAGAGAGGHQHRQQAASLLQGPRHLSPLPQSVSPLPFEGSSKSSSSFGSVRLAAGGARGQMGHQSEQQARVGGTGENSHHPSTAAAASAARRTRTRAKSSGEQVAAATASVHLCGGSACDPMPAAGTCCAAAGSSSLERPRVGGAGAYSSGSGQASLGSQQPRILTWLTSAPDVSQLSAGSCSRNLPQPTPCYNPSCPSWTQQQQQHDDFHRRQLAQQATMEQPMLPRTSARNLSSYAVPLCAEPGEQQQTAFYGFRPMSHSCPNSLRRKQQRYPQQQQYHCHQYQLGQMELARQQQHQQQARYYPPMVRLTSDGRRLPFRGHCGDEFEASSTLDRPPIELASGAASVGGTGASTMAASEKAVGQNYCGCPFCSAIGGRPDEQQQREEANHKSAGAAVFQQQQLHHCQHYGDRLVACMNNVSASGGEQQQEQLGALKQLPGSSTSAAPRLAGPAPHLLLLERPCSSLSGSAPATSRSPLRYGLYESDDDCQADEQHELELDDNLSSSQQQQCFWPNPVQGYDQTMARSTLKSRQRAKSQPPSRDAAGALGGEASQEIVERALYLTKSMENVEKLIREVQSELSALKGARPALGFDLLHAQPPLELAARGAVSSSNLPATTAHAALGQEQRQAESQRPRATIAKTSTSGETGARNNGATEQQALAPIPPHSAATLFGGSLHQQASSATRRAAQFKCVGAIRKAGFLSVKKWILKRRSSIELARKQGWKRYWVCLRGTALLFHSVLDKKASGIGDQEQQKRQLASTIGDDHSTTNRIDLLSWIKANCAAGDCATSASAQLADLLAAQGDAGCRQLSGGSMGSAAASQCFIEREPRHLIIIEGAIAQPIPEHPKRDFVFCLSTSFGDAYLFQASCQLESDNWIAAIHNACAASLARDLTRDEATKLFETKVRRLELEAEKKLFLRQRLESRLTSMSSMSHISLVNLEATLDAASSEQQQMSQEAQAKKTTMRSLLHKLQQQLLALDTYIEQVHCEIYQLRCYLCSCATQQLFYQSLVGQEQHHQQQQLGGATTTATRSISAGAPLAAVDLPHPKSLLMHVSKPTKLLLIKLGVFTVSSLHAYIHARQGSADSILQKIQLQQQLSSQQSPRAPAASPALELELRVRSHSISESLLSKSAAQNVELEQDTEQLIDMSNLRLVCIKLTRKLFFAILNGRSKSKSSDSKSKFKSSEARPANDGDFETEQLEKGQEEEQLKSQPLGLLSAQLQGGNVSDDRYSIKESGDQILINLKLHSNSLPMSIIKQVLTIIDPNSGELDSLNYYLRFNVSQAQQASPAATSPTIDRQSPKRQEEQQYYVAKRRETLNDWLKLEHHQQLELLEKLVFGIELQRSLMDEEEASPFGISIGAQLFVSNFDSQLNVYCSYIEWGSVADKASLKDDDEFLMINGVPVMDLDMMFVECILQDASKLKLVVRSSRTECPPNAVLLDRFAWKQSGDGGDDDSFAKDASGGARGRRGSQQQPPPPTPPPLPSDSRIISDEYISSLVCPPPPAQSSAFLRTSATASCVDGGFLLRQKSDLSAERSSCKTEPLIGDKDDDYGGEDDGDENRHHHHQPVARISKAKSQQNIDSTFLVDEVSPSSALASGNQDDDEELKKQSASNKSKSFLAKQLNPVELANQLLRKTEQLTQLLAGRNPVVDECLAQPTNTTSKHHHQLGGGKQHQFQRPSGIGKGVGLTATKLSVKAHTGQAASSAEQVLALIRHGTSTTALTKAAPQPASISSSATLSSSSPSSAPAGLLVMGDGSSGTTATAASQRGHSIERLRKSVLELLETEYAYIRHLETICEHYMSPLESLAYLNIADLKHLCQVTAELVSFQRNFFDKLIKSIAAATLAEAIDASAATMASIGMTSNDAPMAVCCSVSGSKEKLAVSTAETAKLSQQDEFEELNKIVAHLDLFKSIEQFKPSLRALSKVFQTESERFRLYASYCVAFARLQKLLHPKRHQSSNGCGLSGSTGAGGGSTVSLAGSATASTTIVSLPNALDTFTSSNIFPITSVGGGLGGSKVIGSGIGGTASGAGHVQTHREFLMRPLSSFMASGFGGQASHQTVASPEATQFSTQLKQLGEFLGSLDSSSSSASLSSAKSSSVSGSTSELCQQQVADSKQNKLSQQSAATTAKQNQQMGVAGGGSFQKSVHQQNFESYLIKPIQRIVKYPMLLNSIAISAAQVFALANIQQQSVDYNNQEQIGIDDGLLGELQSAVKQMELITSHVNDAQRIYDDYGLLFDHIERQYLDQQAELACSTAKSPAAAVAAIPLLGAPHQPPIGLGIAQLLYFGPVEWLNVHEFTSSSKQLKKGTHCLSQLLFVFNSCVVFICKEKIRSTSQQQSKRRGLPMASASSQIASFVSGNSPSSNLFANQANTNSAVSGHNSQQQALGSSAAFLTKAAANIHNQKLGLQQEHCQEVIRYQTLIPVSEVQVRSVPAETAASRSAEVSSASSKDCFQWELFRCSSVNSNSNLLAKSSRTGKRTPAAGVTSSKGVGKAYLLSCSTNEARSTFLRKIRFTIRESVRNMSLPLARSPSSKSLTPKKFSSPSSGTNTNSSCSHSTSLSPVCCQKDYSNNKDSSIHLNRKNQLNQADDLQRQVDDCEFASSNQVVAVDGSQFKTSIGVNI